MYRFVRSRLAAAMSKEIRVLLVVLVVTLLVQAIYYVRIQALYPPYGLTTEHYYSPRAINLLHHGVYGIGDYPDIERSTKRPPLYSLVLAGVYGLFGEDERYGLLMNNFFLWLTIIVVYLIGRTHSPAVGALAALLFVLDPIGVISANANQADVPYGLLFALFFLVTLRAFTPSVTLGRCLLISLLLGLATLMRTPSLYLGIPLALAFFVGHRWFIRALPLSRIAVLTLALFSVQTLMIGGWMIRNNSVSGNAAFAGMSSIHLYSFYLPRVISKKEGISYQDARSKLAGELKSDEDYLSIVSGGEAQRYVYRKSIRLLLQNPVDAALVILEQTPVVFLNYPQVAATLFLSDDRRKSVEEFLAEYSLSKSSRLDLSGYPSIFKHYVANGLGLVLIHGVAYKIFYVLLMLSGALGTLLMLRNRHTRAQGILYLAVVLYMVLVFSTVPSGRLRTGILPVYSVVAAYSVMWLWSVLRGSPAYTAMTRFIPRLVAS